MAKVFISYRRKDCPYAARLIRDALVTQFGRHDVFFDVENILPSQEWKNRIESELQDCQALVVVIGRKWRKLLENSHPEDMVRHEVLSAKAAGARVYPVLVDGVSRRSLRSLGDLDFIGGIEPSHLRIDQDCGKDLSILVHEVGTTVSRRVKLQFSKIPSQTFQLGDVTTPFASPVVTVKLTHAFKLSTSPLTIRQHELIMGTGAPSPEFPKALHIDRGDYPTHNVTWFDALHICNKLSAQHDLPEYYKIIDSEDIQINEDVRGFRLPTEVEWELACRLGFENHDFEKDDGLVRYAVFGREENVGPQRVSSLIEDKNGSFDLLGNVLEWCWDSWSEIAYDIFSRNNSPNPAYHVPTVAYRVVRGGCYRDPIELIRPWARQSWPANLGHPSVGLRIAQTCDC